MKKSDLKRAHIISYVLTMDRTVNLPYDKEKDKFPQHVREPIIEDKETRDKLKQKLLKLLLKEEESVEVVEAIKVVIEALQKDEGYYISWKANIAMAFQDEVNRVIKEHGVELLGELDFHNISNNAADNFLKLLINK